MKEFKIELTATAKRTFHLRTDSQKDAMLLVDAILENSDLLQFSDEDVETIDVNCEEVCGGVCEICENACEECGCCTEIE